MDALQALHSRVSISRVTAPAPDDRQLENIKKAALRAADHGRLRPWRFLVIKGAGLDALGELFVAAKASDLSKNKQERLAKKTQRAPMIIVAIANQVEHPKVPMVEQIISTGAAVQNMLNAAYAQGIGAMWRTGELSYDQKIEEGLGLSSNEKIVGFLYLGTPHKEPANAPSFCVEDYFSNWPL